MHIKHTIKTHLLICLGACIAAFGLINIHQVAAITEGGVIGLILLINHWFGISPSIISPILDLLCYAIALPFLGWAFLRKSCFASLALMFFLAFWEWMPRLIPNIENHPILAALLGGVSIGVGIGIIVRVGGSAGGDDALALVLQKILNIRLAYAYLFTDLTVLLASLSYIPVFNILTSLITVTVSSYLIDIFQKSTLLPTMTGKQLTKVENIDA